MLIDVKQAQQHPLLHIFRPDLVDHAISQPTGQNGPLGRTTTSDKGLCLPPCVRSTKGPSSTEVLFVNLTSDGGKDDKDKNDTGSGNTATRCDKPWSDIPLHRHGSVANKSNLSTPASEYPLGSHLPTRAERLSLSSHTEEVEEPSQEVTHRLSYKDKVSTYDLLVSSFDLTSSSPHAWQRPTIDSHISLPEHFSNQAQQTPHSNQSCGSSWRTQEIPDSISPWPAARQIREFRVISGSKLERQDCFGPLAELDCVDTTSPIVLDRTYNDKPRDPVVSTKRQSKDLESFRVSQSASEILESSAARLDSFTLDKYDLLCHPRQEVCARAKPTSTNLRATYFGSEGPFPISTIQYGQVEGIDHGFGRSSKSAMDPAFLKNLLTSLVEERQGYHGRLVASLLVVAQASVAGATGPDLDHNLPDPFAKIQQTQGDPAHPAHVESRSAGVSKKLSWTTTQAIPFASGAQKLPQYSSIDRLDLNILGRNDKCLRYLPYFSQEEQCNESHRDRERREELLEMFRSDVKAPAEEKECAEKAEFWRVTTEDFMRDAGCTFVDVMHFLLHDGRVSLRQRETSNEPLPPLREKDHFCTSCKVCFQDKRWAGVFAKPSERDFDETTVMIAGLVCSVFLEVLKFSIWHILSTDSHVQTLTPKDAVIWQPREPETSSLCMICHLFDCPNHGAYLEQDERKVKGSNEDSSDDIPNNQRNGLRRNSICSGTSSFEEGASYNIRQNVALPERSAAGNPRHVCGPLCLHPGFLCAEMLSSQMHEGHKGTGHVIEAGKQEDPGYADDEKCSDTCFWDISNRMNATVADIVAAHRRKRFVGWDNEKIELYNSLLEGCLRIRRGPCVLALAVGTSCISIFYEMVTDINITPHPPETPRQFTNSLHRSQPSTTKRGDGGPVGDISLTGNHHKRPPFIPCSHSGACYQNLSCSCWQNKVTCERICACIAACSRRFRGCKCMAHGSKVCFNDPSCDCFALGRECDPWLCGACGIIDILDPANRADEKVLTNQCKNGMIQRGTPKRTLKGLSQIHGWGLFSGEIIRANEFIGEYKGEVISKEESNRRGLVYHHRGLEYLFQLNKGQEIDGSRAGNKMRFLNNSNRPGTINVYAKTMLCNMVQRIGLFAKKDISAGEELFFNYGYPISVTRHFWEKEDLGEEFEKPKKGSSNRKETGEAKAGPGSTLAMNELQQSKARSKQIEREAFRNQSARATATDTRPHNAPVCYDEDGYNYKGPLSAGQSSEVDKSAERDLKSPRIVRRKRRKHIEGDRERSRRRIRRTSHNNSSYKITGLVKADLSINCPLIESANISKEIEAGTENSTRASKPKASAGRKRGRPPCGAKKDRRR